ncbi:hypothetical protein HN011_001542 [Eciton burchellii]|nr:hypothetical protein HN011_001542 [Eciton burchellii]
MFTLAWLGRNAVPTAAEVEVCFLNNPDGSRNESTRWQTTHNRRHGAPRSSSSSVEGSSRTSRFTSRWGMGFLRAVLKFVAAVKIKAARRAISSSPPLIRFFSEAMIPSALAGQKRGQTKVRATGSPNTKLELDTERVSMVSIGRVRFYSIFCPMKFVTR